MTSGRYNLKEIADCVRLVRSAAPSKELASRMLAVIERTPGAPTRDEVLTAMRKEKNNEEKHF